MTEADAEWVAECAGIPEAVPEDVPLAVEEVLWKGLAKSKADRFPTCSEFVAAMERAWQPA